MAFRISLNKANKAQMGAKAKAEDEAKAREEKNAMDKVMADVMDEHGESRGILGDSEKEYEAPEDVFVPTGARRHFTGRPKSTKSGPGTLGPEPGAGSFPRLGGPGGFAAQQPQFGNAGSRGSAAHQGAQEENVFTTVVAKASNLPPAIDTRRVEELFAGFPSLNVVKVERITPSSPNSSSHKSRPSATMKITFDKDASARDLDDAMYRLNDKRYLGRGYYLHLDRYLGDYSKSTKQPEAPFAATIFDVELPKGVAPPPGLGGQSNRHQHINNSIKRSLITANAPPDVATMRLIHQTIEGVIEGGVEFEAALMQDDQVQKEERFAWLFDQTHPLNRYYRWRLHEIVSTTARSDVFSRQPDWKGPNEVLMDEFASELGDLSQPQDQSESESEDEEKPKRMTVAAGDNYPGRADTGYGILSPRSRALLIWLLYTIPPTSAMNEEVAAISQFAVHHATKGLGEVVEIIITNLFQPFALSPANPKNRAETSEEDGVDAKRLPPLIATGLHLISDIIMTTSKEGGQCYKYRSVFGIQLKERKVFEYLETVPSRCRMGLVARNHFRADVNYILKIWMDEQLFENSILEHIDDAFNERQRRKDQEELDKKAERRRQRKRQAAAAASTASKPMLGMDGAMDVEKMEEDSSEDGEEGTARADAMEVEREAMESEPSSAPQHYAGTEMEEDVGRRAAAVDKMGGETAAARARRLRPKAEDMFASDGE
ncbi:unnamed protein product [Periconia digitata]|uniref:SURP motif domain-containing protein n=1 Tax=Periconia digitata TaxID=1303443 RepID=A0A9W4UQA2_9PLEO|nr:unnamed protein product [Periconia digitata]